MRFTSATSKRAREGVAVTLKARACDGWPVSAEATWDVCGCEGDGHSVVIAGSSVMQVGGLGTGPAATAPVGEAHTITKTHRTNHLDPLMPNIGSSSDCCLREEGV